MNLFLKFLILLSIFLPVLGLNCTCGYLTLPRVKRITGGRDAQEGSHPWFAALVKYIKKEEDFTQPFCGGTLISSKYILTAGHCIYNKSIENIQVLLDFYNVNDFDEKKHAYKISKFIVHPNYVDDLKHPKQDIGLIKLEKEIQFSSRIVPACLPDSKPHNDNDTFYGFLTTVGWGRLNKNGELPDHLQEVQIFQDVDSCSLVFGEKFLNQHICLKDTRKIKKGWKDVCKGDSGGPLLTKINKKFNLIGVTSFSNCLAIPAAAFSKVRVYLDWIKENTKDSEFCKNFV